VHECGAGAFAAVPAAGQVCPDRRKPVKRPRPEKYFSARASSCLLAVSFACFSGLYLRVVRPSTGIYAKISERREKVNFLVLQGGRKIPSIF